jgi:hypothetical protein
VPAASSANASSTSGSCPDVFAYGTRVAAHEPRSAKVSS